MRLTRTKARTEPLCPPRATLQPHLSALWQTSSHVPLDHQLWKERLEDPKNLLCLKAESALRAQSLWAGDAPRGQCRKTHRAWRNLGDNSQSEPALPTRPQDNPHRYKLQHFEGPCLASAKQVFEWVSPTPDPEGCVTGALPGRWSTDLFHHSLPAAA